MSVKICFDTPFGRICIPIYVIIRKKFRVPGPDPDPRRLVGIDLGDLLEPGERVKGEPKPIPWLEEIGLDLMQQRGLAAMVQIAEATSALPEKLGAQIGAMIKDEIGSLKLAEGVSLHLDMMPGKASAG